MPPHVVIVGGGVMGVVTGFDTVGGGVKAVPTADGARHATDAVVLGASA